MALPVSDYRQAIDALFARTAGHIRPGLSRTEALLLALGDPHRQFPAFHVAGTNGKGSVCPYNRRASSVQGRSCRPRQLPHHLLVKDFREPKPRHRRANLRRSRPGLLGAHLSGSAEQAWSDVLEARPLVMAFWYFANQQVDVAVIETGLGGTHDSTNCGLTPSSPPPPPSAWSPCRRPHGSTLARHRR